MTRFTSPNVRTRWTYGSDLTPIPGASVAYNEAQAVVLVVWRDQELAINLQMLDPSTGTFSSPVKLVDGSSNDMHAAETPSIVCGPSAVGSRPCVIAWAAPVGEGSSQYQMLKWLHVGVWSLFGIKFFSFGSIVQQGYVMYSGPQVAYKGPTSSNTAFLLSWNIPGATYYTIGKPTTETAYWDWTTLRSHSTGSGSLGYSPSVGAAGGAYEVTVDSR